MPDTSTGPTSPPDHGALVLAAQGGDHAAFAVLYRSFASVVHGIALARCGVMAADDVTQEVFLRAFERLAELRDPAALPGWLCALARNAAADHVRRGLRQPSARELGEAVDSSAGPVDAVAERDAAELALACVRELPEAYRETLVLRLVEGLTGPEIAARTGLTHGSVRVNLTRGMAMLRPLLREKGLP